MDYEEKKTLLVKLLMVWEANPTYSLMGLLEKLSGKVREECLIQTNERGVPIKVDAGKMPVDLSDFTNEKLEAALECLLD